MSKCFCEDHALELKGFNGPRWPMDPMKFTFHMCYRCGRTWLTPESSPKKTVKTSKAPVAKTGGFAVYKVTDGVLGYQPIKEEQIAKQSTESKSMRKLKLLRNAIRA